MHLSESELSALLSATHGNPHRILGMHPVSPEGRARLVIRAFLQDADSCAAIDSSTGERGRYPLTRIAREGVFEGLIGDRREAFPYKLSVTDASGSERLCRDPYSFAPTLDDGGRRLFDKGREGILHRYLGANFRRIGEASGIAFTVWAPNARRVSVVGDFNQWDGHFHPMRLFRESGVWELFIPGLESGERYKFEILGSSGEVFHKSDPYGVWFESPPGNASITCDLSGFVWEDTQWMEERGRVDWRLRPITVYEVHAGSWKRPKENERRSLTYRELADELVDYVNARGFTHVEFLPLTEHPFAGSWGYQVTGFLAPIHRLGKPMDLMYLVNRLHENRIGVIMDWVPAHFASDAITLAKFDGDHLYEHADPRQGVHPDWGTLIFDYGRVEVSGFLIASALSWCERFHIDGLRVDAVASMLYLDYSRREGEWIPNKHGGRENLEAITLLRRVNDLVHSLHPGVITIAEESTTWPGVTKPTEEGGLGFDFKWNLGWMHDTLEYFRKEPSDRKRHQNQLTFGMLYQYSECFVQVFSHDEVVHGKSSMINKMPGDSMANKAQSLRALYALMWTWPGKKTLFMGSEFGQSAEWDCDGSLEWSLLRYKDHEGVGKIVTDLNGLYRSNPNLHEGDVDEGSFRWVSFGDSSNCMISFLRLGSDPRRALLVVGHYGPNRLDGYRVGVPFGGCWKELINSDAAVYGGGGIGNRRGCEAEAIPCDGNTFSLQLVIPPNATVVFGLSDRGPDS